MLSPFTSFRYQIRNLQNLRSQHFSNCYQNQYHLFNTPLMILLDYLHFGKTPKFNILSFQDHTFKNHTVITIKTFSFHLGHLKSMDHNRNKPDGPPHGYEQRNFSASTLSQSSVPSAMETREEKTVFNPQRPNHLGIININLF